MASSGQRRKRTAREASNKREEAEIDGMEEEQSPARGDGDAGGTKKRKKKRFVWTDNLHKRFVAAIFDHGLRTVTPKILFDLMKKSEDDPLLEKHLTQETDTASSRAIPAELTSDHIKSHLQKYRGNSLKSRKEFLHDFERASAEAQTIAEYEAYKGTKVFPPNYSTYPVSLPRQYQNKEYPSNARQLPQAVKSHFVGDDEVSDKQDSNGVVPATNTTNAYQQQPVGPGEHGFKSSAWKGAPLPGASAGGFQQQQSVSGGSFYGQPCYPPPFYNYGQPEQPQAPVEPPVEGPPGDRTFVQPQMYPAAVSSTYVGQPTHGMHHVMPAAHTDPHLHVPTHTVGYGYHPSLSFNESLSGRGSVAESQGRSSDGAHSDEGRHRSVSEEIPPVDPAQREQHIVDQLQHLTGKNEQVQPQQEHSAASAVPRTSTDTYSKDGKPIAAVMLKMQSAIEAHRNISYAQQLYQNKYAGVEDSVPPSQPPVQRNQTDAVHSQRPRAPQQHGHQTSATTLTRSERDASTFNLDGAGGESDGLSDCSTNDSIFGTSIAPGTSPPMGPSFTGTDPRQNSPQQRENLFGFLEGQ
eukprot:gb/GECG01000784.1/.p1 GENE.gb/GECG01000784.1/~~gb/GECG01000784.1/.p1  ORF type:complete len:579 (+),score=81.14 gb/GECG01000784.1/:1-1737(+)